MIACLILDSLVPIHGDIWRAATERNIYQESREPPPQGLNMHSSRDKNATCVPVDFKAGMTSLLVAAWGHDSVKPIKNLTFMVSL